MGANLACHTCGGEYNSMHTCPCGEEAMPPQKLKRRKAPRSKKKKK